MAAFPDTVACVLTSGFTESLPIPKKYLGGGTYLHNAKATISVGISSQADMVVFTDWYVNTIDSGILPFTIVLPLYGKAGNVWNVRITNESKSSLVSGAASIRNITMTLEVLDSIS